MTKSDVQPLPRLRRITADRMARSAREAAAVTLFAHADFGRLKAFRSQHPVRIPVDVLAAKAVGISLRQFPLMNAEWTVDGLRTDDEIHVGIAVALGVEGLVVIVLRNADGRALDDLAAEFGELKDKAVSRKLAPMYMTGSTFTITNLGAHRVDGFTPIINPPETAILGLGRVEQRSVSMESGMELRDMCPLSMTFDHRVVDGNLAATFLDLVLELLESPERLLEVSGGLSLT